MDRQAAGPFLELKRGGPGDDARLVAPGDGGELFHLKTDTNYTNWREVESICETQSTPSNRSIEKNNRSNKITLSKI